MLKIKIFLVVCLFAVWGCGSSPDTTKKSVASPNISKELAQDKADALKGQLAVVGKICPGLSKYAADISYTSYYQDSESGQVNFEFTVNNNAKTPNSYRVHGHTCFFRVLDGNLRINKGECLSLCQDKPAPWDGSDVFLPLN